MTDFGLADLWLIVQVGGGLVLCIIGGILAIAAWPKLVHGLAALFDTGNERRPLVRFVRAAGEDMSSYQAPQVVRDAPEPVEPMAVRADADAERTSSESVSEPVRELSTLQNRDALILQLAQMKYPDGKYCLSANAICGAVGGTAADVKAKIAAVRGTGSPPPRAMQKGERLARPEGGW